MKIFQRLKEVVDLLAPYSGAWMICGGVAACIYRDVPRFTGDIDIAIADAGDKTALLIASDVLKALGYSAMAGYVTDHKGTLLPGQALVIGREKENQTFLGVDFLLPALPWVANAVVRAQSNQLDYGFARVPTITVEDLCIAKIYALLGTATRHNDRDDIVSIISASPVFDSQYFTRTAKELDLAIPAEFAKLGTLR